VSTVGRTVLTLFSVNVVNYEYWDVVVDSSVILGQLTAVALYATLFIFTYTGVLTVPFLLSLALFLLVLGFFTRITLESDAWTRKNFYFREVTNVADSLFANLRSLILVFFAVWTLSPILRTLTEPLSNDTLIASSATCFAVHLFSQDYAYIAGLSDK
jgi:phosphatidylinositol glycan class C protein